MVFFVLYYAQINSNYEFSIIVVYNVHCFAERLDFLKHTKIFPYFFWWTNVCPNDKKYSCSFSCVGCHHTLLIISAVIPIKCSINKRWNSSWLIAGREYFLLNLCTWHHFPASQPCVFFNVEKVGLKKYIKK